jgi:hypothetical protein
MMPDELEAARPVRPPRPAAAAFITATVRREISDSLAANLNLRPGQVEA